VTFGDFAPGIPPIRHEQNQQQGEQDPAQDGQHRSTLALISAASVGAKIDSEVQTFDDVLADRFA
jgi:hypothetical protein